MMKVDKSPIKIGDVVKGYKNSDEDGVVALGGTLNIRPAYQREFVYEETQRNKLMDSVMKGFPINIMYWVKNTDGTYEVLDGQQRLISICEYMSGNYSLNGKYIFNLDAAQQEALNNYELDVYIVEGTDLEKMEWFQTINVAGEKLTQQELRNAVYACEWLMNAKKLFSKTKCAAFKEGSQYLAGKPIRQDYLETIFDWYKDVEGCNTIEAFMAKHTQDKDADFLMTYLREVLAWVKSCFPINYYRAEQKGVNWGDLYNKYHNNPIDAEAFEAKIVELMRDSDVTNKRGIYPYIFSGDEKKLSIREFPGNIVHRAYQKQAGVCPICGQKFDEDEFRAHWKTPWSQGGHCEESNCEVICDSCLKKMAASK